MSSLGPMVDARGVAVELPQPPRRVVSLVPSTTETLFALGVGDRVVGVTRFCVHPAEALVGLCKVGGTKDLDLDRLAALNPDLVLANAEENTREIFAAIEGQWPLYVSFPRTVDDAVEDLSVIARLVDAEPAGARLRADIREARAQAAQGAEAFSYSYLCWWRPAMAVGDDTFVAAMLAELGGRNVHVGGARYPVVSPEEVRAADVLLLSSEPFPFAEKHRREVAEWAGLPVERVILVDGEACSWHGARMAEGLRSLAALRRSSLSRILQERRGAGNQVDGEGPTRLAPAAR